MLAPQPIFGGGDTLQARLEASRRDAEAKIIMAEANREAIARVTTAFGERELPALYLLGERYIDAVRLLAQSPNAKTLLLPADVLHAVQGILGRGKS